jgi:hypothetical protein
MDDYRHCRKMSVGTAGKALAAWIGRRTCTESHRAQDDIRRRVCAYVCVQRRACVRVYQLAPGNNERIGNRSICLLTDCTSPWTRATEWQAERACWRRCLLPHLQQAEKDDKESTGATEVGAGAGGIYDQSGRVEAGLGRSSSYAGS